LINNALFPVKEVPAIGAPSDTIFSGDEIHKTGYKFIVREDTGSVLSCMTDEYKLVTNQEIYDIAHPVITKFGGVPREVEVLSDGKKTSIKYCIPDVKVKISEKDVLNPEIVIRNSYNGAWELAVMGGAFRLICSNGMIVGYIVDKKTNRHSIYNASLNNLEEMIVDTVENIGEKFEGEFQLLIDTKVPRELIMKEVFKMIPDKYMEPYVQYIIGQKPNNFWDLHNSLTWLNTHHMKRGSATAHKFESNIHPTIVKWAQRIGHA